MKYLMAALILASPLAAVAADNPDSSFYNNAAEAGIFEVDAGNLAQQKGTTAAVKDFGALMVKDHTAANDKLKSIADAKGISLPTSAGVAQMATKAKLELESGNTFDKAYIESQLKAHRMAIKLFSREAGSGKDAEAKAFAKETLPTLESHLKKIVAIGNDAGVKTTAK
jgi:putative membrane protein